MIEIDGSHGEAGGQIVRTALALSVLCGKAFRITNIRQGRPEPGLKAQHVQCIEALKKLCVCDVEGATLGSSTLTFTPGKFLPKNIEVNIGTAGSITLLLQSILLPCMFASKPITLKIMGGTDVKWAMPVDYFKEVLVPQLRRYCDIDIKVIKRGYYPKGGGVVEISFRPK
ncbi:RNA 3'-terminal phosphate cyclase, partial [Candidatus Woesearchaeota archaeon]|nr:RNA 3'-terminal phosphate cyclase [Candidatus Woesearchaeota archaeon]